MADASDSFIPKRNPVRRSRHKVSRQVYLFTIFCYTSLLAALIAAAGVFFYSQYTEKLLTDEVAALDAEIRSFSEAEMNEVLAFEGRLEQANYRFNHSVSLRSLLEAVEAATLITAEIKEFRIVRDNDESYQVEASVVTDSFDSTIFQRGVLERNQQIAAVEFASVNTSLAELTDQTDAVLASDAGEEQVVFNASLTFLVDAIPLNVKPQSASENVSGAESVVDSSTLIDSEL